MKTDPEHKKVMNTLRSFMEDDEVEYTEAVEAAVSKPKYLLRSSRKKIVGIILTQCLERY